MKLFLSILYRISYSFCYTMKVEIDSKDTIGELFQVKWKYE